MRLAGQKIGSFAHASLAGPSVRLFQALGSETFAALATAAIDDSTAAGCGHADQETMCAFASDDAWLISSLH